MGSAVAAQPRMYVGLPPLAQNRAFSPVRIHEPEATPLPDGVFAPSELRGEWSIAQVYTRHEKTLAALLDSAGVGYYLPLARCVKRDAMGKRRTQILPLIPGYVFVCPEFSVDLFGVSQRSSVYGVIRVVNQKKLVGELDAIHRAALEGRVTPYPYPVVGQRCEIRDGHPMRGVQGVVIFAGGQRKFILQVEMLGQSISVEDIDPEFLEVID